MIDNETRTGTNVRAHQHHLDRRLARRGIFGTGIGVALGAALALVILPDARPALAGGKPCARSSFQTELVEKACAKDGQKGAKKAMKAWVKKAKKQKSGLECATCHSSMAPDYELESGALELYRELGGK